MFHIDLKGALHIHQVSTATLYIIVLVIVLAGYVNAINSKINELTIRTHKAMPNGKLTIVMASDIHLGTIIGEKELGKLVGMINNQNPDLVLFVGDIFDEDIAPVVNGQMGKLFEEIKAKFGVLVLPEIMSFIETTRPKSITLIPMA